MWEAMNAPKFPVPETIKRKAWVNQEQYNTLYEESLKDPEGFWGKQAQRIDWIKPFTRVKNTSFEAHNFSIRWFEDGILNAAANCLDRHLSTRGQKIALIFEGDETKSRSTYTYQELHEAVCRFSNVLLSLDVKRGDRVLIYLPQIPEAVIAMLACARIGAIHCVVFGGFSPEALMGRIVDCGPCIVITADEVRRGGKSISLKENVDSALGLLETSFVRHVVVVNRSSISGSIKQGRDLDYAQSMQGASTLHVPEAMNAEDPLFILYTSGSTGKPKGVLHTTGGYLVYASLTHQLIFDYHEDDIYWCTADVGWITGHTYNVYGPLSNGATILLFEGIPTYPTPSRLWEMIDRYQVSIFYTAPTVLRALMSEGNQHLQTTNRRSLRVLGTVGEPINPEAWLWYHGAVGNGQCPIVDTWWQTETGGILITPLPGATDLKPGSAAMPFFGVNPAIVDNEGVVLDGPGEGNLVILDSWPGQMRTVYGDHQRFIDTYFKTFKGCYFTGDGARLDCDGYYWITGRVDDVINVSGHRLGTAEIEAALNVHPSVAESAVVGYPHPIKGQGIYAYVMLFKGDCATETLTKELLIEVQKHIGSIAKPDYIQLVTNLPRTRSGKIMRRILRKIACNEVDSIGDTSTLADPSVVDEIIKGMHTHQE
jgi:acetyl-CoA synthetase